MKARTKKKKYPHRRFLVGYVIQGRRGRIVVTTKAGEVMNAAWVGKLEKELGDGALITNISELDV